MSWSNTSTASEISCLHLALEEAADYTLDAAHGRNIVASGVQLALDRANFGSGSDAIHQNHDVVVRHELNFVQTSKLKWPFNHGGFRLPKDSPFRWPFSLAHLQASRYVEWKASAYDEWPRKEGQMAEGAGDSDL
jgi:hypothetical protein